MSRSLFRWLWLGALLAVLGGCATVPPPKPTQPNRAAWTARKAALGKLSHWTLDARAGSGGLFGWSGSLHWAQAGQHFDIRVAGPLGIGAVLIQGSPGAIQVHTAHGVYRTTHPERFLRQRLNMVLPVAGLRFWALGLPKPGEPAKVQFDDRGLLRHMQQAGWTLTYSRYARTQGVLLPKRLTARQGDTRVRIVVERWRLAEVQ